MSFAATMVNYIVQSNMTMVMLAMVQPANTTDADPVPDVRKMFVNYNIRLAILTCYSFLYAPVRTAL